MLLFLFLFTFLLRHATIPCPLLFRGIQGMDYHIIIFQNEYIPPPPPTPSASQQQQLASTATTTATSQEKPKQAISQSRMSKARSFETRCSSDGCGQDHWDKLCQGPLVSSPAAGRQTSVSVSLVTGTVRSDWTVVYNVSPRHYAREQIGSEKIKSSAQCVCMPVCLSACLPAYMSTCLSAGPVCLPACLSLSPPPPTLHLKVDSSH